MSLTWRVYRDASQAPIPVVRGFERPLYSVDAVPGAAAVSVTPYRRAVGLRTGTDFSSGATLPESILTSEPVLLYLEEKDEYGMLRRLARPIGDAPRYNAPVAVFDEPDAALLIPRADLNGPDETLLVRATPLGRGCFAVPRGYPHLYKMLVGGERLSGRFDYDDYHGVFYIEEEDGTPIHEDVPVRIWLSRKHTRRVRLEGLPEGTYLITTTGLDNPGESLATLRVDLRRRWEDARHLPTVVASEAAHRIDHTQFDGDAVSRAHLFIIHTDAPIERVEEAVARTLPAGSIYRVEPLT